MHLRVDSKTDKHAVVLNWMSILAVRVEGTFAPICPRFSDSVFSRRFGREDPLAPHSNCYSHCIFERQFPHPRDRTGSPLDTADAKRGTAVCFQCTVVGGNGGKEFSAWLVFGSEQVESDSIMIMPLHSRWTVRANEHLSVTVSHQGQSGGREVW